MKKYFDKKGDEIKLSSHARKVIRETKIGGKYLGTGPKLSTKSHKKVVDTKDKKLTTFEGVILTVKEKQFIDKYLEYGNARRAYVEVYRPEYDKMEDGEEKRALAKIITTESFKTRNKPYIAREIRYLQDEISKNTQTSSIEVMDFFTKVMRGEINDQFGLDPTLSDRISAAKELVKRTFDIDHRAEIAGGNGEVHIVIDWDRDK